MQPRAGVWNHGTFTFVSGHRLDRRSMRRRTQAPLRAVMNTIEAEGPSSAAEVAEHSFELALYERDPVAAARALANIPSQDNIEGFHFPHAWYEGLLAKLRQDAPGAHSAFTAARAEAEKIVRARPGSMGTAQQSGTDRCRVRTKRESNPGGSRRLRHACRLQKMR